MTIRATGPQAGRVLSIGAVVGGQHDRPAIETAIRSAALAVDAVAPNVTDQEAEASVNVIFQVSGHLFRTDHEGVRTGRFTRAKGLFVIEVGVPDRLGESDALHEYFADSLIGAVDLAAAHLAKRAPHLSIESARQAAVAARELMLSAGPRLSLGDDQLH